MFKLYSYFLCRYIQIIHADTHIDAPFLLLQLGQGRRVGDTVLAAIGCNLFCLRRGPYRWYPNMGHG